MSTQRVLQPPRMSPIPSKGHLHLNARWRPWWVDGTPTLKITSAILSPVARWTVDGMLVRFAEGQRLVRELISHMTELRPKDKFKKLQFWATTSRAKSNQHTPKILGSHCREGGWKGGKDLVPKRGIHWLLPTHPLHPSPSIQVLELPGLC